MNISIRLEEEKDFKSVEYRTREAFWDLYKPGCDEHLVVHKIRKVPAFVKELDFVAYDKDTIVGNIIYSRAKILNEESKEFEVLCMGPLTVPPSYQKQGIGSLLMNHSIERARQLGYKVSLFLETLPSIIALVLSMLKNMISRHPGTIILMHLWH